MTTTTNKTDIRAAIASCLTRENRVDDYAKSTAVLVIDNDKCFRFAKPFIETNFCHPDEPEQEAREWRIYARTYEHFRNANLAAIDRQIEVLQEAYIGNLNGAFIFRDWDGLYDWGVSIDRYYIRQDANPQPMTEEQRDGIIEALRIVRDGFEKRLQTWWKRYGADKLHCWTYWAEA